MDERPNIGSGNVVLEHLRDQFNNADTSDVTVVVDKQTYHMHKVILGQSHVLKVMLYGPQWQESHSGVIELNEEPNCVQYVEAFFRFFYTGAIEITEDALEPLMYLADKYCVNALVNMCCEYMDKNIYSKGDLQFVLKCWKILHKVQVEEVRTYAKTVISWNMDTVLKENYYMDFEAAEWKALLSSPSLVVSSEMRLYKALISWLDQDEEYLQLLPLIKFPMMSLDDLVRVERGGHFQCFKKDTLMAEAYKYHAMDFSRRNLVQFSMASVPRLYTAGSWDDTSGLQAAQQPGLHCSRGNFCLPFRLCDLATLSQWTKISQSFQLPMSLSQADTPRFTQWEVTLMRKFKVLGMGGATKTSGLLCLEIKKTGGEPLPLFQEAHVLIYEQVGSRPIIRQTQTVSFDMLSQSQIREVTDLLPYEDIIGRNSTFAFRHGESFFHLAMDIVLVPHQPS